MNKTAYLVMLIRVDGKCPKYAGLGVYSEPCPTFAGIPFVVTEARGRDYEDALSTLFSRLATPAYRWALRELARDKWHRDRALTALALLERRHG
jgi:hypothetical protein